MPRSSTLTKRDSIFVVSYKYRQKAIPFDFFVWQYRMKAKLY